LVESDDPEAVKTLNVLAKEIEKWQKASDKLA
jgi:hypothetical protein